MSARKAYRVQKERQGLDDLRVRGARAHSQPTANCMIAMARGFDFKFDVHQLQEEKLMVVSLDPLHICDRPL